MNATVIMPGSCRNHKLFEICSKAVKTCHQTCRANLIFLDNNAGGGYSEAFSRLLPILGYQYEYIKEPFNISRFLNLGASMANTEYIVYSNADVVFYPDWLENIIELWKENPEFYSMHPYSFHKTHEGLCFRSDTEPEKRVVRCDHPGGSGVTVMRKKDGHIWDEKFGYWEQDVDYWKWMKQNGKIAGVCYNSRVDHLIEGIIKEIEPPDALDSIKKEGTEMLKKKWNL
jgi:hypothetical protein